MRMGMLIFFFNKKPLNYICSIRKDIKKSLQIKRYMYKKCANIYYFCANNC